MGLLSYIAQWRGIMKEVVDRTAITVKFLCLLHVTDNYLCSPSHVHGPSMLPTMNLTGDVILAEHVSPRLGKLGPGDLVLIRSPLNPNRTLTKRIVGLEGDRITYFDPRHGDLPLNAVVPVGHVWIQGDNIYASRDSRHFGPIPYGLIEGRVFFRGHESYANHFFQYFYGVIRFGHLIVLDRWIIKCVEDNKELDRV
ncbi:mitochondrial inner membrane protease subunit 1 isoform X2 [Neltuma alba]|uniref:mitochondrial inner membrane protease subunit 1 isoform X2 n=1 Tax=Neltuma alba TaxID=207710 RepID=UPI0010A3C41C|nr:mitochondrial inner membrane protease subunit 1 isoform X2 [Prosopis alba]